MISEGAHDFPVRAATTRRFSLGAPRDLAIVGSVGQRRVLALRSDAGDDPVLHLWRIDPLTGEEVRLLDARAVGIGEADLPPEERARRERAREQAGGVTAYSVDRAGERVACALGGQLVLVAVGSGEAEIVPLGVPVFDPRISPDGRYVALHHDDGVSVVDLASEPPLLRRLIEEHGAVWGRAEFVAAEEMGRYRGMWWSPCSQRLAVTRFEESQVPSIHLADLTEPASDPVRRAYPFAGTSNVSIDLGVFEVASGEHRLLAPSAVAGEDGEYLARVVWDAEPLLVGMQPRDQRALHVFAFDGEQLRSVRRVTGAPWVELVPGSPAYLGGLLVVEDVVGADGVARRALCRDGVPLTPEGLEVRAILAVHRHAAQDSGTVVLSVSRDDPTSIGVVTVELRGQQVSIMPCTPNTPGLHHAVMSFDEDGRPDVLLRRSTTLATEDVHVTMEVLGVDGPAQPRRMQSFAWASGLDVRVEMLELGARRLSSALLLPADWVPSDAALPVVLDPYGGPHAQRVLSAQAAFHGSQWLADQGFAVLVVDGRGTPGRGPAFEHAVFGDLAGPALEDQIDALDAACDRMPFLDRGRVGIRGWSYGGTLAGLAAFRRPDRFRCAILGAPVTDWRLYDTHYTERYLGHPTHDPEAYERSAIVRGDGALVERDPIAVDAPPAEVLVVHGLVDDNVLAAHSLRLIDALHAAGHPFTFLPLANATHMASDPVVAARLLEAQVSFLRRCLQE